MPAREDDAAFVGRTASATRPPLPSSNVSFSTGAPVSFVRTTHGASKATVPASTNPSSVVRRARGAASASYVCSSVRSPAAS
ncbi:hypothetical protein [Halobacterium sp. CBA1126]|uniref:hypothetical protein n=1 Tax=Halobacterium sp. CBA1126 TaxID=2668074 RepID=UPI0012FBF3A7|nr:hypothetical protein [Halobacterium sp. CBA1126]MUV59656.1 hypothetical protein [Halobacterium sp. CBA1126]